MQQEREIVLYNYYLYLWTSPSRRSFLVKSSQTFRDIDSCLQFTHLSRRIVKLSTPFEASIYKESDIQKYEKWGILSRDINIPVLLTITASGLFAQIFLAHLRALGINSSGDTTAFTTPHSYIFWGETGSPIKANSEARWSPSISEAEQICTNKANYSS